MYVSSFSLEKAMWMGFPMRLELTRVLGSRKSNGFQFCMCLYRGHSLFTECLYLVCFYSQLVFDIWFVIKCCLTLGNCVCVCVCPLTVTFSSVCKCVWFDPVCSSVIGYTFGLELFCGSVVYIYILSFTDRLFRFITTLHCG